MVDRLRVSGTPVIAENKDTGEVSGLFDSLDANRVSYGDYTAVTDAADLQDALSNHSVVRIAGKMDVDAGGASLPITVPDNTILYGFGTHEVQTGDPEPYVYGDRIIGTNANGYILSVGEAASVYGLSARNLDPAGYGVKMTGTQGVLQDAVVHAEERGVRIESSDGTGNECKVYDCMIQKSTSSPNNTYVGVRVENIADCKIKRSIVRGFYVGISLNDVEVRAVGNHVYNFPNGDLGPSIECTADRQQIEQNYCENGADGTAEIIVRSDSGVRHNRIMTNMSGGAIEFTSGTAEMRRSVVTDNYIRDDGGTAANPFVLTVDPNEDCVVERNTTTSGWNDQDVAKFAGRLKASGDGATTTFLLSHGLAVSPGSYSLVPVTADAAAEHWVSGLGSSGIEVTFSAAPPSGTDNLMWDVTARGWQF